MFKYINTQSGYFRKLLKSSRRHSIIREIERPEAGIL
jgi:hypothetical protein